MTRTRRDIENELLWLHLRNGAPNAARRMVSQWEQPLFYYLRRLLDSEADCWDVLQDVWMKALGGAGQLRDPKALPAWLYQIARNAAVSHWRKQKRYVPLDDENEAEVDAALENDSGFSADDAIDLHHALQQLTLPHREVITLHVLENFSLEEIAVIVGAPTGTVKSRLHYAKRELRKLLNERGQTHE
ncbi:MAG: RNA polymerase sigma factor [Candidatus Hinthialibacter antarcticus]|nr:RNA polymerase sigma factor [Candidatus Hinthialibacter antarcticus]